MNTETIKILNKYNIKLIKNINGFKKLEGTDFFAAYIEAWGIWATPEDIDDFVYDINLCIKGKIEQVENPFYYIHTFHPELTPEGLKFYEKDNQGYVIKTITFPLEDVKILLLAWKDFLVNE